MKAILLAATLLLATPAAFGQAPVPSSVSAGTIEALDAKNGFRTYKFGTPISQIEGLQKKGKDNYVSPKEPLKIGEAKLFGLYFGAYHDKLASVVFGAMGADNSQKLLEALMVQYGIGKQVSPDKMVWAGEIVNMSFEIQTSYSAYASPYSTSKGSKSCTVIITSNVAAAEQAAEKKAAAQKAAGDL
jgi:hypothetical protein